MNPRGCLVINLQKYRGIFAKMYNVIAQNIQKQTALIKNNYGLNKKCFLSLTILAGKG